MKKNIWKYGNIPISDNLFKSSKFQRWAKDLKSLFENKNFSQSADFFS